MLSLLIGFSFVSFFNLSYFWGVHRILEHTDPFGRPIYDKTDLWMIVLIAIIINIYIIGATAITLFSFKY